MVCMMVTLLVSLLEQPTDKLLVDVMDKWKVILLESNLDSKKSVM